MIATNDSAAAAGQAPAPMRLYNTLSREIEPFAPLEAGKVRLYVCGMTVYDHIHIGHARAMVVFDAFVRYLRHRRWDVTFVRNFTDVDDKIIRRAQELGEDPATLAQRYIDSFHRDVGALGLAAPDLEPRVSHSIDDIVALIAELEASGFAYPSEGSVWFDVTRDPSYGKLSGQKIDELRSAEEMPGKRHPADFALWKAAKPGEPAWPSPWGEGRPGWHIECSAMARATLGRTIDIHGGGLDLVFPHHENEVAQSECAHGAPFANVWMHNGLLTMASGQKMGKSLGNVFNVEDALARFPAEALRIYYLQSLYRSPLPWGDDALPDALGMLARLYEAREVAEAMAGDEDPAKLAKELGDDAAAVHGLGLSLLVKVYEALDNDFNTAAAMAHLFELARALNRFGNHKQARRRGGPLVAPALSALRTCGEALGLLTMDSASFEDEVKRKRMAAIGVEIADVEALLLQRAEARAAKDWARADAIRERLDSLRVVVMDATDGVRWRVKLHE